MAFGKREEPQKPVRKAALTIGFGNLMGESAASIVKADCEAISPLFAKLNLPVAGQIPRTPILFLYGQLTPDGNIQGFKGGVQRFAAWTETKLLILAAENPDQNIIKSGSVAEKPYANVIYTNNRNGDGFSRFFREMFERMLLQGIGVGTAYASLAPQGGTQDRWLPGTIFAMPMGNMKIPNG